MRRQTDGLSVVFFQVDAIVIVNPVVIISRINFIFPSKEGSDPCIRSHALVTKKMELWEQ